MATEEITEEQVEEKSAAVAGEVSRMWRWSLSVHIGEGAAECAAEHEDEPGKWVGEPCGDESHFHAWCRLPNGYQDRDIREKALAAKARRIRELNDQNSDAFVILDQEILTLASPENKEHMLDELVGSHWAEDQIEAVDEVEKDERFEHIEQDRQELQRLLAIDPDKRDAEAAERIEEHFDAYIEAIRSKVKELQEPRRAALEDLAIDALANQVRQGRIERAGDEAYNHSHATWTIFIGTRLVTNHNTRVFSQLDELMDQAPEVIDSLRDVFGELRLAAHEGAVGN
jgi:hypothetical protein